MIKKKLKKLFQGRYICVSRYSNKNDIFFILHIKLLFFVINKRKYAYIKINIET